MNLANLHLEDKVWTEVLRHRRACKCLQVVCCCEKWVWVPELWWSWTQLTHRETVHAGPRLRTGIDLRRLLTAGLLLHTRTRMTRTADCWVQRGAYFYVKQSYTRSHYNIHANSSCQFPSWSPWISLTSWRYDGQWPCCAFGIAGRLWLINARAVIWQRYIITQRVIARVQRFSAGSAVTNADEFERWLLSVDLY